MEFTHRYKMASLWIPRIFRVGRIGILSFGIFTLGYQRGMVDYAKDPVGTEKIIVCNLLGIDESHELPDKFTSEEFRRVDSIVQRIIIAAKSYSNMELESARNIPNDEKIKFWTDVNKSLEGHWTLVLSPSRDINAFVSGLVPRKLFVNQGLLDNINPTEDELAMIVAHELSHSILGHTESKFEWQAEVLAAELILMALVDPTGIFTCGFDMLVASFGVFIMTKYSRQHEDEADELGVILAHMAHFDTIKGANVLRKLQALFGSGIFDFVSAHPNPDDRFKRINEMNTKLLGSEPLMYSNIGNRRH